MVLCWAFAATAFSVHWIWIVQVIGVVRAVVQLTVVNEPGSNVCSPIAHCCTSKAAIWLAVQVPAAAGTEQLPGGGGAEFRPGSEIVGAPVVDVMVVWAGARPAD